MEQHLMPRTSQIDPRTAVEQAFSRLWDGAYEEESDALVRRWSDAREFWLRKATKSHSVHTIRSYNRLLDAWFCFNQCDPWLLSVDHREPYEHHLKRLGVTKADYKAAWAVTDDDVQRFVMHMEQEHTHWPWEDGYPAKKPALSPASIGQALAACSSYYTYIASVTLLVSGIEVPIFADASGRRRINPFKGANVTRPKINPYDRSRPLTVKQLLRMWEGIGGPVNESAQARAEQMKPLRNRALINARDRALFRIFIYTGRRSGEVARLRWQDIDDASGAYTMTWTGKGAKHDTQAMPAEVYWEIVCWLKAADRWPAKPGDYIFRAAQPEAAAGLGNKVDPDRPMSTGQINNVMKKLAKRAKIDPEQVHTHTLRHSFAHVYDETKGDLNALRKILGHTSLTTTTIYLNSPGMKRPVDNYSQGFQASLGF